ncbi:MAG TPA: hypothetical protein VIV60_16090, partial [Polyangiaceae bacterium]
MDLCSPMVRRARYVMLLGLLTGCSDDSGNKPSTSSTPNTDVVGGGGTTSSAKGGATSVGGTATVEQTATSAVDVKSTAGWLRVEGNKILKSDGTRFHGRGANIFDTRQCGTCAWQTPYVDEVIRR